jgi:hypothetical protein
MMHEHVPQARGGAKPTLSILTRDQAAAGQVCFTVFECHGGALSKQINQRDDGSLSVNGGTNMASGEYSVRQFDASDPAKALAEIGSVFEALPPYAAIELGVPIDGSTTGKITTKKRYGEGPQRRDPACKVAFRLAARPKPVLFRRR